jgi:type III secretion protein S
VALSAAQGKRRRYPHDDLLANTPMTPTTVIDVTQHALLLILMLSMPAVLTAGVLGVLVGLLQAITQIQDQSIGYAAKLIGVTVMIAILGRWMAGEILSYGESLFRMIATVGTRG